MMSRVSSESGASVSGNMSMELQQKLKRFGFFFDSVLESEVQRRSLNAAIVPGVLPCNLLCILDEKLVHFIFTPAGGMPVQIFIDRRWEMTLTPQQALQTSILQFGFANPGMVHFDSLIFDQSEAVLTTLVERAVREYVDDCIKSAIRPMAIPGYEGLQPFLDRFSEDHPSFDRNVFIAMRFRSGKQFLEIHEAVKSGLAKYGLQGLRSDDKTFPPDGDLWNNVCVYMMGCKYGVCVFEEIDEREFNPNVPLEYGFMRAMNRQVLLLKDIRMPKMPADMTGKLYRNFDTYNITLTICEQISQWAERDLGLKAI
jgi:hypothetical protein